MNSSTRRILVWLAGLGLFLLILLVAFRVYGYFRLQKAAESFQKEAGPLEPSAYAPPRVLETENAGIVLEGGAYAIVMTGDERTFLSNLLETKFEKWDANSMEQAHKILDRNEAAYKVLAQSLGSEKSSLNLQYQLGAVMPIPNYLYFLQARKILGCKARLCLREGQFAEALQAMAVEERLAAALLHEPVLISCFVGEVAQKDYDQLVQELLLRSDAQVLQDLEKQLDHLSASAVPIGRMFSADGAACYATLRERYPDDEGSQISQDRLPQWLYQINRRLFLANLLEVFVDLVKKSTVPIAQQPSISAPKWSPRQIVKSALSPSDSIQAIARIQATNSEMILAKLAVKVVLAAKKSGGYPHDLSGFAAPACPFTGETVYYAVEPDGSAVLSYPDAERFWDRTQKDPVPKKPLFVWRLPPTSKS